MDTKSTVIILVTLAAVVYALPVVPEESKRSSALVEMVFVPGVGPVPLDEFREIQLRQAGVLESLGTTLAPIVATLVGNLLTNIATGITSGINSTITSGFGMVQNTTKAQTFDGEAPDLCISELPGLPQANIPPETYVVPSYSLNHPLVVSAGHVRPFLQYHTQDPAGTVSLKPVNPGTDEDTVKDSNE